MSLLDQVISFAHENPGVVAGACVTVLLVAVTQVVISATSRNSSSSALALDYSPYPLVQKRKLSHNTYIFRFALPSSTDVLGLPLGHHISLCATIDGKEVRRPYTPISSENCQGYFDLLIKVYPAPHGIMSRHLESLQMGDSVNVRGPLGKFSYTRNSYRRLLMVCGGTGITPMWQVLSAVTDDVSDNTQIKLVFANVTESDILMRDQLDQLDRNDSSFSIYYVLNDPPPGWSGGVGFVTKDILEQQFGPPQDDSLVLMCGPPPMNKAMRTILDGMGYDNDHIFKF